MSSGGPGSALYKSTDGGETWTDITRASGLPAGIDGKIGVAISPVDPNRVFALIENENGGLFRSDDAGATWTLVNNERRHPAARVLLHARLRRSEEQGSRLRRERRHVPLDATAARRSRSSNSPRGDSHDIWIDPDDNEPRAARQPTAAATSRSTRQADNPHVVAPGLSDGAVLSRRRDGARAVLRLRLAAGRERDVRADGADVRRSVAAAAAVAAAGRPTFSPGGSEDGYIAPDPRDPDVFYSGTNANGGGFLTKLNRRTGEVREVSPYPRMFSGEESAVIKERWQWTYPIIFSPVDKKTLYTGSQHLWKTTNGGDSWERISPDLTRHDPKTMGPSGGPITRDMNGPEVYAVIFSIAPSKRTTNVIWTGSDDGIISVTKDAGKTWSNVTPKDMPDFGRVSLIDASAFDSATRVRRGQALPARRQGAVHLSARTTSGKTWTKIVTGIRGDDFVHAVREDPTRKGLLYAGDAARRLRLVRRRRPLGVAATSICRTSRCGISSSPSATSRSSTHGRGFYILDNIEPLRQYNAGDDGERAIRCSSSRHRRIAPARRRRFSTVLKQPAQNVRIEILDAKGQVIRTYPDTTNAGGGRGGRGGARRTRDSAAGGGADGGGGEPRPRRTRRTRRLRRRGEPGRVRAQHVHVGPAVRAGATTFPGMILWGGSTNGPSAPPGKYTVRLIADGKTADAAARREAQSDCTRRPTPTSRRSSRWPSSCATRSARRTSPSSRSRDIKTPGRRPAHEVAGRQAQGGRATSCRRTSSGVEEEIYQVRNQSGQDPLNFPIKVNNRLAVAARRRVATADAKPIASAYPIFTDLKGELKVQTDRLQSSAHDRSAGVQRRGEAAGPRADRDQQTNRGFLAVF